MARQSKQLRRRATPKSVVPYVPRGVTGMRYTRTYAGGQIALTTNDSGRGYQFNIGLMPGVGDLLNVYDFYRIDSVDMWFTYVSDTPATTATGSSWPILAYCIDYDDDNPPATFQNVLTSNMHKIHFFGEADKRVCKVSLKPRANTLVSRGGTASLGLSTGLPGVLIDAATPDVPHYGVKIFPILYNSTSYPNSRIYVHTTITATFFGARSG